MRYGLKDVEIKNIQKVLKKHDIKEAILFGSRAKGTFQEGSDIDLAISKDGLELSEILSILVEIDELYLPYKVDLVDLKSIKKRELLEHIKRVGKDFYKEEE